MRATVIKRISPYANVADGAAMRSAAVPLLNFPMGCIGVFVVPSSMTHVFGNGAAILVVLFATITLLAGATGVISFIMHFLTRFARTRCLRKTVSCLGSAVLRLSPVVRSRTPVLTATQAATVRLNLKFTMKAVVVTLLLVIVFTSMEYANLVTCVNDGTASSIREFSKSTLDCSPFGAGGVPLSSSVWFAAYEFQLCLSACLATVGVSAIAWNLAFVRLLVEAQAAEHSHTSAMLRWLSHECRSPVAAALLTLESVFQDNLPGALSRLLSLSWDHTASVPSQSLASAFKIPASPDGIREATHGLFLLDPSGEHARDVAGGSTPHATRSAPPAREAAQRQSMFRPPRRESTNLSLKMPTLMLGGFRSQRSISFLTSLGRDRRQSRPRPLLSSSTERSGKAAGEYWLSTSSMEDVDSLCCLHWAPSTQSPQYKSTAPKLCENHQAEMRFVVSELKQAQHDLERIAQPLEALGAVLDDMLLYSQRRDQIAYSVHVEMQHELAENDVNRDAASSSSSTTHAHSSMSESAFASVCDLHMASAWVTAWQTAVCDKDVAGAQGGALLRLTMGESLMHQSVKTQGVACQGGFRLYHNESALAALQEVQLQSIVSQSSLLQVMVNFLTNALKYGQSMERGLAQIETNVHVGSSDFWLQLQSSLGDAEAAAVGIAEPACDCCCGDTLVQRTWSIARQLLSRCSCRSCPATRRRQVTPDDPAAHSPLNPLDAPIAAVAAVASKSAEMLRRARAASASRKDGRRASRELSGLRSMQRGAATAAVSKTASMGEWDCKHACVVAISVTDHGKGLPDDHLHHLFEPFTHLRKAGHAKGNGLGLWLTKQLLELHGGTICAHSSGEGSGCTFTAVLPAFYVEHSELDATVSIECEKPPRPQKREPSHQAGAAAKPPLPAEGDTHESQLTEFDVSRTASVDWDEGGASPTARGSGHARPTMLLGPVRVHLPVPINHGARTPELKQPSSQLNQSLSTADTAATAAQSRGVQGQSTAPPALGGGLATFAFSTMDSSNDTALHGLSSLPLPAARTAGIAASAASAATARKWTRADRVLVVDDAKINRVMLTRRLRKKGLTVKSAEDGKEALELFLESLQEYGSGTAAAGGSSGGRSGDDSDAFPSRVQSALYGLPIHGIVTDMTMPHMTGDELAERVLEECARVGVAPPVIIGVTGNALAGDVERFKRRGADEVLLKPVNSETILGHLGRLLAERSGERPKT